MDMNSQDFPTLDMTLGQQKELLLKRTCQAKKAKLADAHQRKKCDVGGCTFVDTKIETINDDEDSEVKVMVDQLFSKKGANNGFADEFICKICLVHMVGCKPMLARCTHFFCGDCIDQWFKVQPGSKTWAQRVESAGSVPCPVCKEPLREEQDLYPVSCDSEGGFKMLHRMLSGTRIVCVNNPKCSPNGNCHWTGDYGSYQDHIRLCKNVHIPDDAAPAAQITRSENKMHARSMEDVMLLDAETTLSEFEPQMRDALETQSSVAIAAVPSTNEETFDKVQNECSVELASAASQWTGLVGALLEKVLEKVAKPVAAHAPAPDRGHHCPACPRSWREGNPDTPPNGVCNRCGERLQAGMIKNNNSGHRRQWVRKQHHKQSQESSRPSTETEDTCSTQSSERLESFEPSDAELSLPIDDHAEDQEKVKQLTMQWQVAQYHQAAQYQAAQYQVAQYQAAQYQVAQYQAAHYQMAQLRLAQAAYAAEAAYAAQAAQMQAN